MPTFFLLGRTTQCAVHTLHVGIGYYEAELHAWGVSMLFCTPANQNEKR